MLALGAGGTAASPAATYTVTSLADAGAGTLRAAITQRPAASRSPRAASSRALADWFWGETAAGAMLLALQPVCAENPDAGIRHVATSQFVPRAQRHRLA